MAANTGNQRIIPLEEGWNDEIKAKVRTEQFRCHTIFQISSGFFRGACLVIVSFSVDYCNCCLVHSVIYFTVYFRIDIIQ